MALVAKSIGWRTNEENGVDEYIITLEAQTEPDVPNLTFNDIIKNVPLRLTRQEALAASPEVKKLVAEAETRGMERAAGLFTAKPWTWNAHEIQEKIRADTAAIRSEATK